MVSVHKLTCPFCIFQACFFFFLLNKISKLRHHPWKVPYHQHLHWTHFHQCQNCSLHHRLQILLQRGRERQHLRLGLNWSAQFAFQSLSKYSPAGIYFNIFNHYSMEVLLRAGSQCGRQVCVNLSKGLKFSQLSPQPITI